MTDNKPSTRDIAMQSDADQIEDESDNDERKDRTVDTAQMGGEDVTQKDSREEETRTSGSPVAGQDADARGEHEPLLPGEHTARFTTRWQEIQSSFVDEPRDAVAEADALVADLMQRLAASFSNERERLEAQWGRGDDVSTEDLRVALTRYRSFFDRLLSA